MTSSLADFPLKAARRTLLASLVIVGMGFSVLFPILAPLGREMGLSEFQITSIIAASALTVFLSSPIWGRLSDIWGRKRVMVIGLFGFSAGTAYLTPCSMQACLEQWLDCPFWRTDSRTHHARWSYVRIHACCNGIHGRHYRYQ